jgi:predicted GNAT family acetyltransferase
VPGEDIPHADSVRLVVDVTNNADALQYEARVDGEQVGLIRYTRDGDVVTMAHTEVEPRVEGQGIGSELVRQALEDVRAHGRRVHPSCPFVRAYIDGHAEYADLVSDD